MKLHVRCAPRYQNTPRLRTGNIPYFSSVDWTLGSLVTEVRLHGTCSLSPSAARSPGQWNLAVVFSTLRSFYLPKKFALFLWVYIFSPSPLSPATPIFFIINYQIPLSSLIVSVPFFLFLILFPVTCSLLSSASILSPPLFIFNTEEFF